MSPPRSLPQLSRSALALMVAMLTIVAAACGGSSDPAPTPAPTTAPTPSATATRPTTPPRSAATTATPSVEESGHPPSRISNVRAQALSPNEVLVSFDYHLELAPEQNAFVHQGLLPVLGLTLLDAGAEAIARIGDELAPTEFGLNAVAGEAAFVFTTARFADISAVHISIRVWTGGGAAFGLHDEICKPFDFERVQ